MATTCSGCGVSLNEADVLYTPDAKIVCGTCNANADILATEKRAGNNIKSAGFGALGMAALTFIFNPFFLFTVLSTASAVYVLKSLSDQGDERFTKHIKNDKALIYACCGLAILINVVVVIGFFTFMAKAGAELSHRRY